MQVRTGVRITYIGHATLLLEVAGKRILTDPNFDPALGRFLRRVAEPGIALESLPRLDAVLVTHAHADHLSLPTLDALPHETPVYAPPSAASWLVRLGYNHIHAMEPGETMELGGLRVSSAAAVHRGSRYGVDWWRADACMYLIDSGEASCFFAGDTALRRTVETFVHSRLDDRPLDVALLPIGHAPWWKPGFRRGHLTSDDALTLFERLRARYFIPYHWGTFRHVTAGAFDAIRRLRLRLPEYQRSSDVKILEPGSVFDIETAAE